MTAGVGWEIKSFYYLTFDVVTIEGENFSTGTRPSSSPSDLHVINVLKDFTLARFLLSIAKSRNCFICYSNCRSNYYY